MNKKHFIWLLAVLAMATWCTAGVSFGIHVGINLPVVYFRVAPVLTVIPDTYVYAIPDRDDDFFFYDDYWYRVYGGCYYRSSFYNGPWDLIEYGLVPAPIIGIPSYWRQRVLVDLRMPYWEVRSNWKRWHHERHWEHYNGWHYRDQANRYYNRQNSNYRDAYNHYNSRNSDRRDNYRYNYSNHPNRQDNYRQNYSQHLNRQNNYRQNYLQRFDRQNNNRQNFSQRLDRQNNNRQNFSQHSDRRNDNRQSNSFRDQRNNQAREFHRR